MTALTDGLAKVYDRKNLIFMQYGNQWLIHKFDITKTYVEKIVKERVHLSIDLFTMRFCINHEWHYLLFFQGISKRCIKISNPENF